MKLSKNDNNTNINFAIVVFEKLLMFWKGLFMFVAEEMCNLSFICWDFVLKIFEKFLLSGWKMTVELKHNNGTE